MQDSFSTIKVSHGHGQISQPFVSLQKGSESLIRIEKQVKTIDHDDIIHWINIHKDLFPVENLQHLEVNYSAKKDTAGLVVAALGFVFLKGDFDGLRNKNNQVLRIENERVKSFIKDLYLLTKRDATLSGEIIASGTSFIPIQPVCFMETTTIEFENGVSISLFNTKNYVLARHDGVIGGVESQLKKKIKISHIKKY